MIRSLIILLAITIFSAAGCNDDEPTASECEQIEDPNACWDAGCARFSATPATVKDDGTCSFLQAENVQICVFVEEKGGEDVGTVYFRDTAPNEDIWLFGSNHGELKGWTKCEAAGRGQSCGCTQ